MTLNGRKRIGIIASVVWILGVDIYALNVEDDRNQKIAASMNGHTSAVKSHTPGVVEFGPKGKR